MKIENLEEQIKNIDPNNLSENDLSVIESAIQELDKGNIRVASNKDNEWLLNEWVRAVSYTHLTLPTNLSV